jgi:hypothetical protein
VRHADPVLLPPDAAVATDQANFEVAGVFHRREPRWLPRRSLPALACDLRVLPLPSG